MDKAFLDSKRTSLSSSIAYAYVWIGLGSAKGITANDIELAKILDETAKKLQ